MLTFLVRARCGIREGHDLKERKMVARDGWGLSGYRKIGE